MEPQARGNGLSLFGGKNEDEVVVVHMIEGLEEPGPGGQSGASCHRGGRPASQVLFSHEGSTLGSAALLEVMDCDRADAALDSSGAAGGSNDTIVGGVFVWGEGGLWACGL